MGFMRLQWCPHQKHLLVYLSFGLGKNVSSFFITFHLHATFATEFVTGTRVMPTPVLTVEGLLVTGSQGICFFQACHLWWQVQSFIERKKSHVTTTLKVSIHSPISNLICTINKLNKYVLVCFCFYLPNFPTENIFLFFIECIFRLWSLDYFVQICSFFDLIKNL